MLAFGGPYTIGRNVSRSVAESIASKLDLVDMLGDQVSSLSVQVHSLIYRTDAVGVMVAKVDLLGQKACHERPTSAAHILARSNSSGYEPQERKRGAL